MMISEDKPLTVYWGSAQADDRRASTPSGSTPSGSATFEVCRADSSGALEDALGDGTKILTYARIRVTEPSPKMADAGDVEALPSTVPGAPIVAIGCGPDHFVHVYIGIEDEATMTSVLTHDIQLLSAPC